MGTHEPVLPHEFVVIYSFAIVVHQPRKWAPDFWLAHALGQLGDSLSSHALLLHPEVDCEADAGG